MRNLATSLKRRARRDPMEAYDRLPPETRAWLARAALPWSAASVLGIWRRAGTAARGLERLSAAEAHCRARDAPRIWRNAHPTTAAGER